MADLVIRKISRSLIRRLEANARKNGRSVSEEAKQLLEAALRRRTPGSEDAASASATESRVTRKMGQALLELVPDEYRGDDLVFEIPDGQNR
jgi:plasmid stability protein